MQRKFEKTGLFLGILGLLGASSEIEGGADTTRFDPTVSVQAPQTFLNKSTLMLQQAIQAVVSINAIGETETISPFGNDPFFSAFFGVRQYQRKSSGSGVIVDPRGYIVTCAHVVQGAKLIKVTLSNGRTVRAEAILVDESLDLAVMELDGAQEQKWTLPFLSLSTNALLVGETVFAIGNAFSVGNTVTKGIISASGLREFANGIFGQTDAPINPGNSGGPILRKDGSIAGISSAIASRTGASHGVGFFIPAMAVQYVMRQAIQKAPPVGAPFQVSAVDVSILELLNDKGIAVKGGVVVLENFEDVFKEGDIILSVAGFPVTTSEMFHFCCQMVPLGERYPVTYIPQKELNSNGEIAIKTVSLKALKRKEPKGIELKGEHFLNGVTVADITPEIAKSLQIASRPTGVVVLSAPKNSMLQRGDIILEVNGCLVKNVASMQQILSQPMGRARSIQIQRGSMIIEQRAN